MMDQLLDIANIPALDENYLPLTDNVIIEELSANTHAENTERIPVSNEDDPSASFTSHQDQSENSDTYR